MALLRDKLNERKLMTVEQLNAVPNGRIVHYCQSRSAASALPNA
jgi:hypothetical protein